MRSSRLSLKHLLETAPLRGREDDENEDGENGDEDRDQNGENGSGSRESDNGEDNPDGEDGRDPQVKIRSLEGEKQRHYRKRQEAERENQSLREQLEEYQRKDKSELENTQSDLQTTKDENEKLHGLVQTMALNNAFLSTNDIVWHNPKRALQLADLSEVEIDDEGNVDEKALRKAMKKLAEEEPYLVKNTGEDEEPDQDSGRNLDRTGNPSSGSSSKHQRKQTEREQLMRKYPSLRQHAG